MINRQITIRPQDIVALIKIISFNKQGNPSWLRKDMAAQLYISNAEVTNIFDRLRLSALIDVERNVIQNQALYEYLIYGLKHTFPAYVGHETKGILTGVNAFLDSGIKGVNYVWEDYQGEHRGYYLSPLYPEVVSAVRHDQLLYGALIACDMLRVGQSREINYARNWLRNFIMDK